MSADRRELVYVVGHYTRAGHTAHLDHFLEVLGEQVDLHVVVWSHDGELPSCPTAKQLVVLPSGSVAVRLVRLAALARTFRRAGCSQFVVRIAHHAAIALATSVRPFGGQVFLWHSGISTAHRPRWRFGSIAAALSFRASETSLWLALRMVNGLLTGPSSMVNHYVEQYGMAAAKASVLANDVDVRSFRRVANELGRSEARRRLGVRDDEELIIYVGAVSPLRLGHRGDDLAEVAAGLLQARPSATLVLLGEVFEVDVESLSVRCRAEGRIRAVGPSPFVEVVPYYRAADLLVLPVRAAGFPRVLLEAMALGCPFVAYDVGGVREVAGSTLSEQVVGLGDARSFVSRATHMLALPDDRERAVDLGHERVESFSTEVVVQNFLAAIFPRAAEQ